MVQLLQDAVQHMMLAMSGAIAPAVVIVIVIVLLLVDRQSKRDEYFKNLK